jgi:hypothetical protein
MSHSDYAITSGRDSTEIRRLNDARDNKKKNENRSERTNLVGPPLLLKLNTHYSSVDREIKMITLSPAYFNHNEYRYLGFGGKI